MRRPISGYFRLSEHAKVVNIVPEQNDACAAVFAQFRQIRASEIRATQYGEVQFMPELAHETFEVAVPTLTCQDFYPRIFQHGQKFGLVNVVVGPELDG